MLTQKNTIGDVGRAGKQLMVLATCSERGATLSCAAYARAGELLSVASLPVKGDGLQHEYRFVLRGGECHHVRLLLLDARFKPICESRQVDCAAL